MITIIDYHCGNTASIQNMLKKIGCPSEITSDPSRIEKALKLILPGVGSFDHGMQKLEELEILPVLKECVIRKKIPILGICLGVQLFCAKSDEGTRQGLGWFDADVVAFDKSRLSIQQKVPHMGWADTNIERENKLINENNDTLRYYYVHSYHLVSNNPEQVIATAVHGYEFAAAMEIENIVGVQFHPEKSHRYGMTVLENFFRLY